MRLEYAVKLLENSKQSLLQIAQKCGFNGLTPFGVAFKRRYGSSRTRSEWRKRYKR